MEIAALVIGIIALLALTQGGNVSGSLNVQPNAPIGSQYPPLAPPPVYVGPPAMPPPPQTYSPYPAPPYQTPMVPSTGANTTGVIFSGGASIGTGIVNSESAASQGATGIAAAAPVIGAAIGAIAAIATSLLQAHQARLTGATNENQAVDQWVPVFDSFVSQIVGAYNARQISASQCAQACQQFDQALYNKFRSFVGQPGTKWTDSVGQAGQCNSNCTAACCVYWQDLSVVLNDISYVLGFPTGKWGAGDPRISGRTVTAPKVYPSKYSSYSRASYTVTLH